ncbi:MAG: hypothetical protein Kow00109_00960 [Acidobacteriota bacterium]
MRVLKKRIWLLALPCWTVAVQGLPAREEVLAGVYPGADIKTERLFLTEEQIRRVEELAGSAPPSAYVVRYRLVREGREVGRAYVDTHVVRSKRETLLICLDAAGTVRRVEVVAFQEPPEYRLPDPWFEQYRGKSLADGLRVQRDIRPVVGATLSTLAAALAVRRVLALDELTREEAR